MNKKIIPLICAALFLSGCTLGKSNAGLIVKSQPSGTVYVNDKEVGRTPYENKDLQPGSYVIKIKSENGEWSSDKIRILENTIYNINQELAPNSVDQAGEKVSIEKGKGVTVVTTPSQVEVSLDGTKQGNTPYLIPAVSEGDHEISLAKEGYVTRKIKIRVRNDYKIVIEAQLKRVSDPSGSTTPAPSPSVAATPSSTTAASPVASPTSTTKASVAPSAKTTATPKATPASSVAPTNKPAAGSNTVTVLTTPTGWLRVRDKAGIDGKEIGKINEGETYEYKDQLDSGWTLIVMGDGTEGYVASKYVKVNK